MSDEENQSKGNITPAEEHQVHDQPAVVDDARTRALAEALQSSFKIVRVLMVVLAIAFLCSGITKVDSGNQALQLRFGKFKSPILESGLHFAWPYPIDEIVQIPVNQNRTITSDVGWRTKDADDPQDSYSFAPDYDGYTLTGDGNTLHIKAEMNFSLKDSETTIQAYEFKFNNVTNFLQSALDNAVYHASANRSSMNAYTRQSDLQNDIRERITKVVNQAHDLPIQVNSLTLDVTVPIGVKPAYDAFLKSQQESQQKVSTARAEATSIIANAEGQARVIESKGKTTADRLLTSVEAEAKSFTDQRPFYESNPKLFQQRLVSETMQNVLTNAIDIFYLSGRQPRIWLNRTPAKPKLKEGQVP
ncbi:MAG: SPFH domain-containing protein [Verrucomicrobiota bacterium]|nr:SPFH domain-containing protein [Verrucomicrobiota bacterium]